MIVWSGRGFLAVLVLFAGFLLFNSIIPREQGDFAFALAFIGAAAFSWFLGKKWNEEEGTTVVEKSSGQEYVIKPNHSLFWIKLQYWGFIFGALGVVFLITAII